MSGLTALSDPSMWSNERFSNINTTICRKASSPGVIFPSSILRIADRSNLIRNFIFLRFASGSGLNCDFVSLQPDRDLTRWQSAPGDVRRSRTSPRAKSKPRDATFLHLVRKAAWDQTYQIIFDDDAPGEHYGSISTRNAKYLFRRDR